MSRNQKLNPFVCKTRETSAFFMVGAKFPKTLITCPILKKIMYFNRLIIIRM